MVDPRFYASPPPTPLSALFPDCEIKGDRDRLIASVATLDKAGAGDLCFFDARASAPLDTKAGAVLVRARDASLVREPSAAVITNHPRAWFAQAARKIHPPLAYQQAPSAIAADARIEEGAALGPHVTIGPGAQIGAQARLGPGVVIGPGVRIGRRTQIGANAVIEFALVGDDVTILAGACVGQTGFGMAPGPGRPVDMPHFGRVIIEDRVTLGANSTIDRGLFDDTVISEDAKIDNLCHIAHNVVIGRAVLIAAFGGISGSCTIGDGAILAGRVGLVDHISVGVGAQIGGGAAVTKSVPAGERWTGYPARPLQRWLRDTAWLMRAAERRDAGK